jgi:hypothetical protein
MLDPDFDPLEDLEELKKFAVAADMHIMTLIQNQESMVKQINDMAQDILQLTRINQELMQQIGDYLSESSE